MGVNLSTIGFPEGLRRTTDRQVLQAIENRWKGYNRGQISAEEAILLLDLSPSIVGCKWFWVPIFDPNTHLRLLLKAGIPGGRVNVTYNSSGTWVPGVIVRVFQD